MKALSLLLLFTPAVLAETPAADRIQDRKVPSVFQAWNPIDSRRFPQTTRESRLAAAAKHGLIWEAPIGRADNAADRVLGAAWDHSHQGLATRFTPSSLQAAIGNRAALLNLNPNMIFLLEVRWRDAPGNALPGDSPYWKRNPDGGRMTGWDHGSEPYYLLDADNPDFQNNIARQAKAIIESGVYDGVMLDWGGQLEIVKRVREAIGDRGLIVVNIHDNIRVAGTYQDYINGAFMENNPAGKGNPIKDRLGTWESLREALVYYEQHFRAPRINCLEVWGKRKDQRRMRAATTLALTHSDGYVLYADPNPRPAPDHLHDWYSFWDAPIGKSAGAATRRADGAYQREFSAGTVVYNPAGNKRVTVRFNSPRRRVSDNSTRESFSIRDRDGEIFLKP